MGYFYTGPQRAAPVNVQEVGAAAIIAFHTEHSGLTTQHADVRLNILARTAVVCCGGVTHTFSFDELGF